MTNLANIEITRGTPHKVVKLTKMENLTKMGNLASNFHGVAKYSNSITIFANFTKIAFVVAVQEHDNFEPNFSGIDRFPFSFRYWAPMPAHFAFADAPLLTNLSPTSIQGTFLFRLHLPWSQGCPLNRGSTVLVFKLTLGYVYEY